MPVQTAQPIQIEALAAMAPDAQQRYLAGLPLDQQQMVQAQLANVNKRNLLQAGADYLAKTRDKLVVCPMSNAGALSQAWSTGQTLNFTVPQITNGWLVGYRIRFTGTVTNAAGTSAVYGLTAAGAAGLFPEIAVIYGNAQQRYPLRVWQDIKQLKGKLEPVPWEPVLGSGRALTLLDTYLSNGNTFGVATGANTWTIEEDIPLNLIHSLDPRGLIPMSGQLNQTQINVTCNSAPLGTDALNNALYAVSGSGHSSTVTGTISIYARYRDGDSLGQRAKMLYDVGNLGTVQLTRDGILQNLPANTSSGYQMKKVGKHYTLLCYVIDAQASNAFCADSNIAQLDIVKDSGGTNAVWRVGGDTNVSVNEYLWSIRQDIKQDLPYGVVPFAYAQTENSVNADNQDGIAVFNNYPGDGWPAAQLRVKVTAVGAVGNGPRLEFYTVYENIGGLQIIE